jgi:hypothetical protein
METRRKYASHYNILNAKKEILLQHTNFFRNLFAKQCLTA